MSYVIYTEVCVVCGERLEYAAIGGDRNYLVPADVYTSTHEANHVLHLMEQVNPR